MRTNRNRHGVLDPKGRRDHIVPRVYLRGFIHPDLNQRDGPLRVFDLATYHWAQPKSPEELCTEIGFYDYSVDRADETADEAFEELEAGLGKVRRTLRADRFRGWTMHREFLLRFAHMLVVRSRLFRDGVISARQWKVRLRVLEVNGNRIRYEPFDPCSEPDANATAKNLAITAMRAEIRTLACDWAAWTWALVTAPSALCPFITSDAPVVMDGPDSVGMPAYSVGRFRVVVPFGWDFALVGSPRQMYPEGPRELTIPEMDELRIITTSGAIATLISPMELLDMRWFGRVTPAVPLMPR